MIQQSPPSASGSKPQDNSANLVKQNKGSDGINRQYDQDHSNRGKQLNPD